MLRHFPRIIPSFTKTCRIYHVAQNSSDHYSIQDMNKLFHSNNSAHLVQNNQLLYDAIQLLNENNKLLKKNNQLLIYMNQLLHENGAIPARVEILEKTIQKKCPQP